MKCLVALALGLALLAVPAWAQMRPQMLGRAAAGLAVTFDVYLPLTHSNELDTLLEEQTRPGAAEYHHWLTPAAFAARFGADAAAMGRVRAALEAAGLGVQAVGNHTLRASGPVGAVERLLGTELVQAEYRDLHARLVAAGVTALPPALAAEGAVVAHFSPRERMHRHVTRAAMQPFNRSGITGPYWFDDFKQAYDFPSVAVADGSGTAIGILMADDFQPRDMDLYFGHENLLTPRIVTVPVFGGAAFSASGSDETSLDIQQAAGMAPGATVTFYNVPDLSDASLLAGLTTIVEDNAVDVVSMSFGGPEIGYRAAYNDGVDETGILTVYDDLFRQGNAQGITFVAAAGDLGAYSVPDPACFATGATSACGGWRLSVEFPASSPHVTGVGGSNLVTASESGSLDSTYAGENADPDHLVSDLFFGTPVHGRVWGSGGGVSTVFAQPGWQAGVSAASAGFRIVPDLSLQMGGCPEEAVTPCNIHRSATVEVLNGNEVGIVGTSVATPDIAGVFALKVQLSGGRLGNENPDIYALAAKQAAGGRQYFHALIQGQNGFYQASGGYNPVVGNGSPVVNKFLGLAPGGPLAGTPQSASNP